MAGREHETSASIRNYIINHQRIANTMFLAPRCMPWLEATEKIIDIMTSCISTNRMKYIDKNPDDVVGDVEQKMKAEWDALANV